jgi:putative membrane protein
MTYIDLTVDPVATLAFDYWRWTRPGFYYGIPASNYAGWFLVSALLLSAAGPRRPNAAAAVVGAAVMLFFGLVALAHGLWTPAVFAFVLLGIQAAQAALAAARAST